LSGGGVRLSTRHCVHHLLININSPLSGGRSEGGVVGMTPRPVVGEGWPSRNEQSLGPM